MTRSSLNKKLFILPPLALVLLLALIPNFGKDTSSSFSTATSHQTEKFTELYFDDYESLPKDLLEGELYSGQFIIVNHEGTTKIYSYEVMVYENTKMVSNTLKKVTVGYRDIQKVNFTYSVESPNRPVKVVIHLLDQDQEIRMRAHS